MCVGLFGSVAVAPGGGNMRALSIEHRRPMLAYVGVAAITATMLASSVRAAPAVQLQAVMGDAVHSVELATSVVFAPISGQLSGPEAPTATVGEAARPGAAGSPEALPQAPVVTLAADRPAASAPRTVTPAPAAPAPVAPAPVVTPGHSGAAKDKPARGPRSTKSHGKPTRPDKAPGKTKRR